MRGTFRNQAGLFSYLSLEERVPERHPLRNIRELVRAVLVDMTKDFAALYSDEGRPSIPPEQLLSALLLQAFYGLRSERQLMEQLDYNLLFRWFVGLSPDAPVWVPTTFTKNRERLQDGDVFQRFMQTLLNHPRVKPLLSDEHFSVDGTLIEAWLRSRASSQRTVRKKATARISTTKGAAMKRTPARAIPTAAWIARRRAERPSFAIWAMRRWRTAMVWRSARR